MDLGGGFIPGLQVEDDQNLYLNFYTYMEYVFQLKEDHNFKLMLGYNQEKNERNVIWAKRRDYQFVLLNWMLGLMKIWRTQDIKKNGLFVLDFSA